jgi:hypothetical protein
MSIAPSLVNTSEVRTIAVQGDVLNNQEHTGVEGFAVAPLDLKPLIGHKSLPVYNQSEVIIIN